MDSTQVRRGAKAPEALRIAISNPDGALEPLDLSIVSEVSFRVTDVRGRDRSWAGTISGQSSSGLTATRVFAADGSDVRTAGRFEVLVLMTTPDGERRAGPFELNVV